MKPAALALLIALTGCSFAQKHPAVTAGILGGAVGFTTCAIDNAPMKWCGAIGGGAAVFLGGIVALVNAFLDTEDHTIPSDDEEPPEIVRPRKLTAPGADTANVRVDAGIAPLPITQDAGITDAVISPAHD